MGSRSLGVAPWLAGAWKLVVLEVGWEARAVLCAASAIRWYEGEGNLVVFALKYCCCYAGGEKGEGLSNGVLC